MMDILNTINMRDRKLTQRMWDVLNQWIGDTIVFGEWEISIRDGRFVRDGNRSTFVIWVSIDYRGTNYAHISLESKDIGETDIPTEVLDLLKKAFDRRMGKHLNSNPCTEIPLMPTTTEAETNTNSSSINGYHYDPALSLWSVVKKQK